MGSGDGNRRSKRTDRRENLGTTKDRATRCLGGLDLDIGVGNGGRPHNHVGRIEVGGIVPERGARTHVGHALKGCRVRQVAAADVVAHGQKHLGDRAHACATDADDVHAARS